VNCSFFVTKVYLRQSGYGMNCVQNTTNLRENNLVGLSENIDENVVDHKVMRLVGLSMRTPLPRVYLQVQIGA